LLLAVPTAEHRAPFLKQLQINTGILSRDCGFASKQEKILQILPSGLREAQSEPLARRSNFVVLTRAGPGGSALWAHHKDDLSRERPLS